MKTYHLQTFYKLTVEVGGVLSDISARDETTFTTTTNQFTQQPLDILVVKNPKTLAAVVEKVWAHNSKSNLDSVSIRPVSKFKIHVSDDDPAVEDECLFYQLIISKKQQRSKFYDYKLQEVGSWKIIHEWKQPVGEEE